jgi:putative CocE/NonD family hydrolase
MQNELPLARLEEFRGIAAYYYDWLSHPPEDPWWQWCELQGKYEQVQAAVLNFSAWYDDNYGPEGATTNFAGLVKARSAEAERRTHLLLGPWVHGVGSTAKTKSGEREFGAAAVIDYDEVVLRWMDHYLRGIDNGVEKEKPVRYFVMGDNQWRDAETWPPKAQQTFFYLISAEAGGSGSRLSEHPPTQEGRVSSFFSDPANPVTNPYESSGGHDYRELARRSDVLTFDSAPLDGDLEVTGPIDADVYMTCDCRDADLYVRLLDVAPDGTAFNLMSPGLDGLRASYRDLKAGRQLLEPHKVYELKLDHLMTSNVFQKGHRIRVQISAAFFPNFSRNLQTGESETKSDVMQKATISIYTDHTHPSHVVLPVVSN